MQTIEQLINARVSVNHFQAGRPLATETIHQLVALATRAPTAFNMQNWRFIAVQSAEAKARLLQVANGQVKVVEASVSFIVCGKLAGYQQLPEALSASVQARIMPAQVAASWADLASTSHRHDPALQRDEAFRSASLACMTLMLAAEGMGLSSCPISGFDADQLRTAFELEPTELPVMIISVGYPASGNWPQKLRKPVEEVLSLV
ncbi:nitroreductase family protein [Leeia aquatica]|uniref:Nitroreductase family protein n=1 Tax=Leeia aquatica TaxID=2725557 RepID=A0A847SLJ4_9NEIS|nr:nitroreductase family protein [Leeia aquatica]NLR76812.1 nitroreductase family protein [Leeia aquatica]